MGSYWLLVSHCMGSYWLLDAGPAQVLHVSAILDILLQLNNKGVRWVANQSHDQ